MTAMTAMTAMTNLQKAKVDMLMHHAFFATVVMSTKLIEDRTVPTACTDMVVIRYNPDFIDTLDKEVVVFVLAHEVMHIVLKHGLRCGHRNHKRWNIACDFAINWLLHKAGFIIWKQCYCDAKYDGMSAEQIYDIREKEREEQKGDKGKGKKDKGGGPGGPGQADTGQDEADSMGEDLTDVGDLTPAERTEIEQGIIEKVAQAASVAKMQGQMPADIERLVEGILRPPLSWQQLLREFATQVTPADEDWCQRDRRFGRIYLPDEISDTAMGELVIIGDTSGSMGNDVFAQAGAEITAIAETMRPERVRVLWADDCECSREEVFERGDEVVLHPKGGGGTDMRKPLKYAEQFNPIVVILITDCYTPWPDRAPPYPLITLSTTSKLRCPHGITIDFNIG